MSLKGALLGRLLSNREQSERKIGAFEGVPAMGLDGLGSSAYGPEAALSILIPVGALGLAHIGYVMVPIIVLLGILYVSYRQTIRAYPTNGGAYTVAKENLGTHLGVLAAAALMIDYVLNVAVGISAGVAALVSAVPGLHPYMLELCLAFLFLIAVVNLRGTLDAGRLFALPTYVFVISFVSLIAIGCWKALASGGHPAAVVPPPALPPASEAVTLWLLLRAFASGCTAMTGVEAVSNGVAAFRDPAVKYGHRTLSIIVGVLGLLLAGISYLVAHYGIGAMDQTQQGYQSVLSQLAAAVAGRNWSYYVAIGSLLCVLVLSANTSFVDFPRLCRLVAKDCFLPRAFAIVGRRLVFSIGIIYLAVTAGLLLIAFGGVTDRLIPLFAIGAFMTFTLSQAGMVAHWLRELRRRETKAKPRISMLVNGAGAAATGIALLIIIIAKFTEGAWITLLVIPIVIALLNSIHRYYRRLERALEDHGPIRLGHLDPPVVVVAIEGRNRLTDKALAFALTMSSDVYAVHFTATEGPEGEERHSQLRRQWARNIERPLRAKGLSAPKLLIVEARYRRLDGPLLKLVDELQQRHPDRVVAMLLPEIVKQRWWQYPLHTHRARRIRAALLACSGPRLVLMNVPWRLKPPKLEGELEEEMQTEPEVTGAGAAPLVPAGGDRTGVEAS
jgi:amino acid transporter